MFGLFGGGRVPAFMPWRRKPHLIEDYPHPMLPPPHLPNPNVVIPQPDRVAKHGLGPLAPSPDVRLPPQNVPLDAMLKPVDGQSDLMKWLEANYPYVIAGGVVLYVLVK